MALSTNIATEVSQKALKLLQVDAEKISKLIEVQIENLTTPQCPLYEEVLDTQMFGFSREIDFAIRLGLIDEATGKQLLDELEQKLTKIHETYNKRR